MISLAAVQATPQRLWKLSRTHSLQCPPSSLNTNAMTPKADPMAAATYRREENHGGQEPANDERDHCAFQLDFLSANIKISRAEGMINPLGCGMPPRSSHQPR